MKVPQVRLLTGTTATAVALAVALGVSAGTATAAPAAARPASSAAAPAATKGVVSQVTGSFRNADGVGKFAGTFAPEKFSVAKGVLEATGVLKGTMTNANGSRLGTVDRSVTMPVSAAATKADPSSCGILNLVLGPLHLNLLGLVVNLNRVHLTITAVSGSGNLLGNLLCAVAHLLDTGGSLNRIAALLNQILALL